MTGQPPSPSRIADSFAAQSLGAPWHPWQVGTGALELGEVQVIDADRKRVHWVRFHLPGVPGADGAGQ